MGIPGDLWLYVIAGLLFGTYWIYDHFFKTSTGYEFEESVTDFLLTPRKTIEKEEYGDTDADSIERDGGKYKVKSFVLNNGEKLMIHSEENPIPHGQSSTEKDKNKDASVKLASRSFCTGFLDNMTDISRGKSGFDIFGILRKIPGPVYFVIVVIIIALL